MHARSDLPAIPYRTAETRGKAGDLAKAQTGGTAKSRTCRSVVGASAVRQRAN